MTISDSVLLSPDYSVLMSLFMRSDYKGDTAHAP